MSDKENREQPAWVSVLFLLFIAFCISIPFGIFGMLGDDYGAICIGALLLFVIIFVVAWVAKVLRAANNVIDRNDPRSPRYRG